MESELLGKMSMTDGNWGQSSENCLRLETEHKYLVLCIPCDDLVISVYRVQPVDIVH